MKKLLIIIFLFAAAQVQAKDIYVSTNGSGSTCSVGSPCALSYANSNAVAGDTVYMLTGTYANDGYISPTNSGSNGSPITYVSSGGTVTISGQTYAVMLNNDDWIVVDGIDAINCNTMVEIWDRSDHNIIKNSTFTNASDAVWSASMIKDDSQYNLIQNCTFSKGGVCSGGDDQGLVIEIGDEEDVGDLSYYNMVEDSVLFHGGHHVLGLHGRYNVIRNNYMHNEAWTNGKGNRVFYSTGYVGNTGYNLVENNRFGYAGVPCDQTTSGNFSLSTRYNIVRYNMMYHSNAYNLSTYGYSGYSDGSYNKIYNNTFFNAGYEIDPQWEESEDDAAIGFYHSANTGNLVKNNLYYSYFQQYGGSYVGNQTFANEYAGHSEGDPLFVNASTTPPADKTDSSIPNLNLSAGSPAIDFGGALTTVTSGCDSSTLVLDNASYFQDGTWGPGLGTVVADWIAVGTVGNVAQISSISGNSVTMASTVSCSNGASVWLYKDSDGTIVLYGSAPDAGANEFVQDSAQAPLPPKNLRIIE